MKRNLIYLVYSCESFHHLICESNRSFSYHASIDRPPFEMLYRRKYRTLICWGKVSQQVMGNTEVVLNMAELIHQLRGKFQIAQSRQKSYVDRRRSDLEFQVGDMMLLKVSPWKGVIQFWKMGKFSPSYIGPFKVLVSVGRVVYRLDLPKELSQIHTTFHVS